MRTSLTRLVAGTAIAATALLAAAGTASAGTTPAPARTPTSLSIVAAKSTITVGHLDTIGGVLASPKGPVVGRAIILDKATAKTDKWVPVEAKLTGKHGGVVFTVAPRIDTIYKLVFKGGPVYKASHSGVVLVVVKPFVKAPTTLSIVESSQSITAGQTDTISGALTLNSDHKALAHQWVWLGVVANGKAHLLRAFLTGKFGKVVFKVKPAASTTYQLVFRGTAVLAPTVSGTVLTTVAS